MAGGDLVFIGDVHLDRGDAALPAFLRFVEGLATTADRIVFLGDLFNLWIGEPELEQPHQTAVVETLCELRRGGVVVRYVEGNRDYRIGQGYGGRAFDDVVTEDLDEEIGGTRISVVHGDLANAADRQYRLWRGISRSRAMWAVFRLIPRRSRLRLAESLERSMRSSNTAFKRAFPEEEVRSYAAGFLADGSDALVLGHFHTERELSVSNTKRVYVLPEWKGSRRHLRAAPDGSLAFVAS